MRRLCVQRSSLPGVDLALHINNFGSRFTLIQIDALWMSLQANTENLSALIEDMNLAQQFYHPDLVDIQMSKSYNAIKTVLKIQSIC